MWNGSSFNAMKEEQYEKGRTMEKQKTYICIDLKSFYASVECIKRGLDPLHTHLVVADASRTEKTICLAVSPSLKSYGIPGRARLFEVIEKVKKINQQRLRMLRHNGKGIYAFIGKSYLNNEIIENDALELDYLVATPNMQYYIDVSTKIYNIYLKYIAKEDIHVYSIDEVFMDVTNYLNTYGLTAVELAKKIIQDVLNETGVTATSGIGSNLYLAKVAMDIVAKHIDVDNDGLRIAILDEKTYRKLLWDHEPLTDFWRIGRGYMNRLHLLGMYTMGDIARCSIENEDKLYTEFGINAELLIDHAWGYEPVTIDIIKKYKPIAKSLGTGQVLQYPYPFQKARTIVKEMVDLLVLDLVDKRLLANTFVLTIGYDIGNLKHKEILSDDEREITIDDLGRKIPKHAHGTTYFERYTSSTKMITKGVIELYDKIVDKSLFIKRINLSAYGIISEVDYNKKPRFEQLSLFDFEDNSKESVDFDKERKTQEAIIKIKKKYGKNAILKGMDLEDGATTIERNKQIGGHKA